MVAGQNLNLWHANLFKFSRSAVNWKDLITVIYIARALNTWQAGLIFAQKICALSFADFFAAVQSSSSWYLRAFVLRGVKNELSSRKAVVKMSGDHQNLVGKKGIVQR